MNKLLSARFLISVSLTLAVCYSIIIGKLPMEVFFPVYIIIVKDYFDRKDREGEKS